MNKVLEQARIAMHKAIETYGLASKEALKASQELDVLTVEEQCKIIYKSKSVLT